MIKISIAVALVLFSSGMPAESVAAQDLHTEDVTYKSGRVGLAALLLLPRDERPLPAAVIVQGSGTSDRSNQWSREIAEILVHHGLAVLLTDKRGSGASGGDWRTASFATLAEDVLAGVEFLQTRSEIDPARVGVVGLSQGGQVAPLAAAGSDQISFVISVSSKAVGFAEGSFLEMANTARQSGLSEPDVEEVLQLNLAALRYLTAGNWEQYAHAREHAMKTATKGIAAGFPASPDEPIWTFLRSVAPFDPLAYWVQVGQPVLVIYGEEDERDNSPVRESVRRLEHVFKSVNKKTFRILVVPGVGHGIRDPQTHELASQLEETLSQWLAAHTKR